MNHPEKLIALVTQVVSAARDFTPRDTVELGFLHGLCLDAARTHHPDLLDFIASPRGLAAVTVILTQLPDVVTAKEPTSGTWAFVRKTH